jgi:hypothetical protein
MHCISFSVRLLEEMKKSLARSLIVIEIARAAIQFFCLFHLAFLVRYQ